MSVRRSISIDISKSKSVSAHSSTNFYKIYYFTNFPALEVESKLS